MRILISLAVLFISTLTVQVHGRSLRRPIYDRKYSCNWDRVSGLDLVIFLEQMTGKVNMFMQNRDGKILPSKYTGKTDVIDPRNGTLYYKMIYLESGKGPDSLVLTSSGEAHFLSMGVYKIPCREIDVSRPVPKLTCYDRLMNRAGDALVHFLISGRW